MRTALIYNFLIEANIMASIAIVLMILGLSLISEGIQQRRRA